MATPIAHMKGDFVIPDEAFAFFSLLIPTVGGTLFALTSLLIAGDIVGGICVFLSIYFYWGFKIVPTTEYLVVERFGEFSRILHSGPRILCLPGLIDKVVDSGTLRYRKLSLFADEGKTYHVDFKDGSTPVSMEASYRVGPQGATNEEKNEAIYLFTYTMKSEQERKERIEGILESAAIPQLQSYEISEALLQKDSIAEKVTQDQQVRAALEAMGVELNTQKGLIIPDIALTPEIIAERQKKLAGTSEAAKQREQGLGYARSIKAIMEELGVDANEARSIYEAQRGLETLNTLKANVSFVAPDMKGIQKTMGVGSNSRQSTEKEIVS